MPESHPADLYRVVAVDGDGAHIVIATHLTMDQARGLVDALRDVSAFNVLSIVQEPGLPPSDHDD